jgi:electron transfer flavoprotein alpha subunit
MSVLCLLELDGDGGVSDASVRALGLGRALAGADGGLGAVAVGSEGDQAGPWLGAYGVTDLHVIESAQLTGYAPAAWGRAVAELVTVVAASAVIAAATDHGSEVMAQVGAVTGLDVVANCVSASREPDGGCRLVRYRWAGSLLEDAILNARPALLTVAADAALPAAESGPEPAVHRHRLDFLPADLLVQATVSAAGGGGVSLATARVVVGGGRGVGSADGFAALEELAGLLGGAVGVSRVVTSQGWRPHRQQVGQTGTRIAPELYLACGISGAIQHLAGCQAARHVIAINTDPDAPIMSRAEYAVIGDLHEVIPALIAALKARS